MSTPASFQHTTQIISLRIDPTLAQPAAEAGVLPSFYGSRFLPGSLSLERRAERSAARSARPPAVPLRSTLSLLPSGTFRLNRYKYSSSVVLEDFYSLLWCLSTSRVSLACQSVEWSALSLLGRFPFSMGTAVSKRKNLRSDAISSVAAKVR